MKTRIFKDIKFVFRILEKLTNGMEDIKNTLIKLLEVNMTRSELKNTLHGINDRLDTVEERTSEFEDTTIKLSRKKKLKKRKGTEHQ